MVFMNSVAGNRWVHVEAHDASGVHASEEPLDEAGWRVRLAAGGELSPAVESLLTAFGRLQRRHGLLEQRAAALGAAFDRLPMGVAIATRETIVVSNAEAERLIDGESLKRSATGALQGGTPALQRKLDAALERVAEDPNAIEALRIEREGGVTQLVMLSAGPAAPDAALIVMGDPDKQISADANVFRSLHGFTPTEARVATYLVLGLTPREIATTLDVGVETTRTHVKHILGKMGCHRQVDAVRRLVVGPSLFI